MLMVLGASHHDLELSQLERLSAGAEVLNKALGRLVGSVDDGTSSGPLAGSVVLATCNRLEIYLDALRFHDAVDGVTAEVAAMADMRPADIAGLLKVRVGAPVVAHLFKVTAGLDSMVVGEAEISGQVSRALTTAQQADTATPSLNAMFQLALRTAKHVAASTGLGTAGRSIASVAIDLAGQLIRPGSPATSGDLVAGSPSRPLAGTRCLVVGTGAYARVAAAALRARGASALSVYSPSGRAESFAGTHGAVVVGPGDLAAAVAGADLVISSSGRGSAALDLPTVTAALSMRRLGGSTPPPPDGPLVIVDLALRPDVAAEVRTLPGVRVIDLNTVADGVAPEHGDSIVHAQDIVIAAVAKFEDDLAGRSLDPAVVALRRHVSIAVEKEMARLRSKYDSDIAADVELSMHRVAQSLLHTPTLRARELARTGDSANYLQALHTLFGIDLASPVPTADS